MLFKKLPHLLAVCSTFLLISVSSESANAGPILADSLADWNTATSDGIDVNGNAVAAGSSADAAQQGHAATSNGTWNYKGTNGAGSGAFSGGPGLLTNWNDSTGCYVSGSICRMGAATMAPTGTFNGDTFAVREWVGSGLAGETLRITGSFDTLQNTQPVSATNNGVRVLVLLDNSTILLDQLIFPGGIVNFDITTTSAVGSPVIRFAVGPQGPGPAIIGSSDFFNDRTVFSGQIEHVTSSVPEPASILLLLSGMLGIGLARAQRPPVA